MMQEMTKYEKWDSEYKFEKEIVEKIISMAESHRDRMKHARLMRNKYKSTISQ